MVKMDGAVLATYRAAREMSSEKFMDAVFAALRPYVPFNAARWGTASLSSDGVVFHNAHLVNEVDCWSGAYSEVRSMDTAARYVVDHPGTTGNFHFPTYFGHPNDAAMRDYTRKVRHEAALITCHTDPATGLLFNISFFGANADRPFTEKERSFAETIYPHLMEAWAVNQMLQMERGRRAVVARPWSMAMCTPSGHITLAEPAFFELLDTEWDRGRPQYALPAALIECIKSGASGFRGRQCVFRFERGTGQALVRGRAASALDRLSERELAVARCLSSGMTHKDVARILGIAPSTVRNHLQSIHRQVGAHNNAELVAHLKESEL